MANEIILIETNEESVTPFRVVGIDDAGSVVVHLTTEQAKKAHKQLGTALTKALRRKGTK